MIPIALINGPFYHHLDHLAPLAYFLECPLIVDDPLTYKMAKKYYPEVEIRYETVNLQKLAKECNCLIVSTKFARKELESLFLAMNIHHMRFCFCPHGQSDKGLTQFEMRSIVHQDIALVYGERQKNRVKELPLEAAPKEIVVVGNFRLSYYKMFQPQLDALVEDEIFSKFAKEQKTILYAPTWADFEHSTSFFAAWESLFQNVPDHYNLIIKLHPLLEKEHPAAAYRALGYHLAKPNVAVVLEMPLIYPLLAKTDLYIGDYSAIGYDFLYFERPMFFVGEEKTPLHEAGRFAKTIEEILPHLDEPQEKTIKASLYRDAFAPFSKENFLTTFATTV